MEGGTDESDGRPMTKRNLAWAVLIAASVALIIGAATKRAPLGMTEVLGFVTGAVCVLLVVEENIWNWPIGIANSVLFFVLFLQSRLYGDMALQVVYVVLGFLGWYQWLYGGKNRTELKVSRVPLWEALVVAGVGVAGTAGMTAFFVRVNDAAPFLDALTTVLSLLAQYLLTRKRLENWYVWIAADVIYVWLYVHRGLHLTAVLYLIFIGMCLAGLAAWRRSLHAPAPESLPEESRERPQGAKWFGSRSLKNCGPRCPFGRGSRGRNS